MLRLGLIQLGKGHTVVLQDVIGEEVDAFGEVFVEDEAQDVVPELIRPHLSTQRVGDVPELGVEGLFRVVGHGGGIKAVPHDVGKGFQTWARAKRPVPGAQSVP